MKVILLDKEEAQEFFKQWGIISHVCYNSSIKNAKNIGKTCLTSGHFSGSRAFYFKFHISGISRITSLQLNRHEVGVVKNQASQQYIDQSNLRIVIPKELDDFKPKILQLYTQIQTLYGDMLNCGISRDAARYILPEGIETEGVWCFTLEALINFMHKRLCSRASNEIRTLAKNIRKAVLEVLPELQEYLVPQCEYLLWCPESKSCGKYPSKEERLHPSKKEYLYSSKKECRGKPKGEHIENCNCRLTEL